MKTANPRIPSPLTAGMITVVKNSIRQYTLHPVFQNLEHGVEKLFRKKKINRIDSNAYWLWGEYWTVNRSTNRIDGTLCHDWRGRHR